ncbi:MAG: homoserine kinase [Methylacidiphilales bacterium]|nr:homoserine kinase [Candidatus Methylacidiphilales bacterium]MDW8349496.1 homoserine kinase [Verrucomicrobiae bacterium]
MPSAPKKASPSATVTVRVPATTANIGPGFDTLGIALKLYNTLTVSLTDTAPTHPPFINSIATTFFKQTQIPPTPFTLKIKAEVPIARGLGSSVTIRLGLLAALNTLHHSPLLAQQILSLVIQLEGHPDNAVPALFGGFAAATRERYVNFPVSPRLHFIAYIPKSELSTTQARSVLPRKIPIADAVENLQHTALITAAFATGNYPALRDLFQDRLHQPYRARLIPGFQAVCEAARAAGALGAYLSGAGSTIMAITLEKPQAIAQAMARAASKAGLKGSVLPLKADNEGLTFL